MNTHGLNRFCRKNFWLLVLVVTFISVALQWGALKCEGVIDDHGWLHDITQSGCDKDVASCFRNPQLRYYYRPLVAVSFVPGKRWYQIPQTATPVQDAFPYHVENLVHHGLVVFLVFWMFLLLFRLLGSEAPPLIPPHAEGESAYTIALLAGTLFAMHPLNVPVTTFIGGRTDNLALIFLALSIIGVLKLRDTFRKAEGPGGKALGIQRLCYQLLSILGFAAAIFTKEQCVLMVLLIPTLLVIPRPKAFRALQKVGPLLLVGYMAAIGLYLFMAKRVGEAIHQQDVAAQLKVGRSFFAQDLWSPGLHIAMVGRTCWYYFSSFFVPVVDRMHQSTLGPWDWEALGPQGRTTPGLPHPPSPLEAPGGYLFVLAMLWLLWRYWRQPACRFCLLWFFLTLAPVFNIIPVPSQLVAPYRAIIPLVGVCGLIGYLFAIVIRALQPASEPENPNAVSADIEDIKRREDREAGEYRENREENIEENAEERELVDGGETSYYALPPVTINGVALVGYLCCCLILGFLTILDVPWWQDDGVLMQAEIHADPNFVPARFGEAYLYDTRGLTEKAIESYSKGLKQLLPEAHTPEEIIRASTAPDIGRRIASASSLRYLDIPWLANNYLIRARLYQQSQQWSQAAEDYRVVRALLPEDTSMGDWLAYALRFAGRWQEEETVLKEQIRIRADSYRLSQLGGLYFQQRRWAEARDTLARAFTAPESNAGATADMFTARRQYQEAVGRAK